MTESISMFVGTAGFMIAITIGFYTFVVKRRKRK